MHVFTYPVDTQERFKSNRELSKESIQCRIGSAIALTVKCINTSQHRKQRKYVRKLRRLAERKYHSTILPLRNFAKLNSLVFQMLLYGKICCVMVVVVYLLQIIAMQ